MIKHSIKNDFPIFKNNRGLVYLDNASSTQKPKKVIDAITNFYSKDYANVHRGLYPLSEKATDQYENARRIVAEFINAEPEEIIFVQNATDGINSIANILEYSGMLPKKPKIILSELEHHSNIIPWQRLNPSVIEYLMLRTDFQLNDTKKLEGDILAITHASNVTGTIIPIEDIILNSEKIRFKILDASQTIGHKKFNVKKLGFDFVVFSSHKVYGPTGVGVIYGRKDLLNEMEPFRVGGGMIRQVRKESSTWGEIPEKFEAGTPSIADAIGLGTALKYLENVGFEKIENEEKILKNYLLDLLKEIPRLKIYHNEKDPNSIGIISFTIDGIHPHDLAYFLGVNKICVRAGHHCTQILHREILQIPASLRVSLGIYNERKDIDLLIENLKRGIKKYS